MELEKRLIKLAADAAVERQAEFIKEWPKKIKREAAYLSGLLSPEKVSEAIKINKGTLQTWIKKFSAAEDPSFNFEEENITVTRIVAEQFESLVKPPVTEQLPVASIVKDKLEFKVYCKDMAEKLVEKLFI